MILVRATLAAALLLAPAAALAQQPTTVTPVSVESAKQADEKSRVVCKRIAPTGSRTPGKKICRTAGEWAAEEKTAKETLDDTSRRALQSAPRM
ncbi:hypothetical protein GVN21_03780 [Caulobacter sp. SLTY]|uniref:hypothetical protein n=1 Tax=Caulobacter sp. SLTY TaxID=2683262 RepID=UPI0014120ECD|nr:hypothetical protein [Caulobacter sp. SLTY]NBB14477.1 hypothetical protein [Caulobacter sp. SLTY]